MNVQEQVGWLWEEEKEVRVWVRGGWEKEEEEEEKEEE